MTQGSDDTMTDETAAGDAEKINESPWSSDEEALESLYKRLPKVIARVSEANPGESRAALERLFQCFRRINDLELSLLPEDAKSSFKLLSLSRIYELAVSGGGGDEGKLKELEEANRAFLEENEILSQTIESLGFQIERLKAGEVDKNLESGKATPLKLSDLKTAADSVKAMLDGMDKKMSGLRPGDAESVSFKGLDERYFDALKGAGDLSPEMLKTASETTTSIGKILRKAGFAYDHKDLVTIRMIVGASLKANRKLAGTIAALTPAKHQIDRIHEIISRMEVYAGHEERKTPQYKDALEEIDRLQQRLDSYRQKSGEMEDLENDLAAKRKEIKEQQEKVESGEQRAREINSAIDDMNGKIEAQMEELEHLKQRSNFQEMLRNNDELKEDVEKKGRQILDLKNQARDLEDKRKSEEESLKDAHRSEIAALKSRMRMIEGGLLVEKLESEVQSLREIAREAHDGIEQERELRKAFEDRVEIWVQNEEDLKKDAEKWKKRAAFRYGFAAAACGIAALAGFSTGESSSLFAGTDVSLRWFYYTLIGGFATLGFFMGKGSGEKGIGAVVGGMVGLVAAFVGSIPIAAVVQSELNNKNKVVQQEREALLKDCQDAPCRLVKDKDGNFSVQVFTREYAGERVTFDLTDVKSPKFIRQSPLNRPQDAPAAQAP